MNQAIQTYLATHDAATQARFNQLYQLILESAPREIEESLWARLPTFACGKNFVRLIPFKDHINVEARAILAYRGQLAGWNITPKGMLQIGHQQEIPAALLIQIFRATLDSQEPL